MYINYLIKDLLPNTYLLASNQTDPIWADILNFEIPLFPVPLIDIFETEMEKAKGNVEVMLNTGTAFATDITNLAARSPSKRNLLNFIKFHACTSLTSFLSTSKLFTYCFDWISNSLDDEVNDQKARHISLERLAEFGRSKEPFILNEFSNCIPQWTSDLFYYSRNTGGHIPLCEVFIQEYFLSFNQLAIEIKNLDFVKGLMQISSWAGNNGKFNIEQICANSLYAIFNSSNYSATSQSNQIVVWVSVLLDLGINKSSEYGKVKRTFIGFELARNFGFNLHITNRSFRTIVVRW